MSSLAHSLVTWEEFVRLPERPETGQRYELQDGEVIVVPPARPLHIKLQKHIERLLEAAAGDRGVVTIEFPYRPVPICSIGLRTSNRCHVGGRPGILDRRCRKANCPGNGSRRLESIRTR